ncbi:winged helix-turn-helix transcriptional regulator [Candidatus Pacearchaeota archaeon]|nr:winged helix-turn-helix transcriptional regulator [Candidatus Pacearchaeota archaeon]
MKNTDTKEKILELLFDFPTARFHVREISRKLKISAPAVSKALKELENHELIKIEKNFLYEIKANSGNDDFKNLKRVSNLKKIYLSGLSHFLSEKFPLSTIILFGSYSRGEDIENSDIDIAVIGSKEREISLEKYEKLVQRKINLQFYPSLKNIEINLKSNILNGITLKGGIDLS